MKKPTHALKIIDNNTGDRDIVFLFAYKDGGVFYSYDTNKRVLDYDGDEILQTWELST